MVAKRIIGMDVEEIFADMGAFWSFCKPWVLTLDINEVQRMLNTNSNG